MSITELPAALATHAAETTGRGAKSQWIETALAVLFAAAAVLLASSLAVVTGLV
jgi:hypothetical protein